MNDLLTPAKASLSKKKAIENINAHSVLVFLLIFGLSASLALTAYLYSDAQKEADELADRIKSVQSPQSVLGETAISEEQQEYISVVNNLKSLINIAPDEIVNVAIINNTEEVAAQDSDFYKDAMPGHYLIVLPDSQKVIIFDNDRKVIVNFGSYTVEAKLVQEENIDESEKPLTIEVRYSSGVDTETLNEALAAINAASSHYNVIATTLTPNSYQGVHAILLKTNEKPQLSQNFAIHTGVKNAVRSLPEGEANSDADVVLILGEKQ